MSPISDRKQPEYPCWGCGETVGVRESMVYYGEFSFGIQHGVCGERIEGILERSLRALACFKSEVNEQTREIVARALITTSARKLGGKVLDEIEDDDKIRQTVEKEGLPVALATFRSITLLDEASWENYLKDFNEVMAGPKCIEERPASPLLVKKRRVDVYPTLLERVSLQVEEFINNTKSSIPYCILKEFNYNHTQLQELLRKIDQRGVWRVIFLVKDSVIQEVALMPSEISIEKAKSAWIESSGFLQADVYPLAF